MLKPIVLSIHNDENKTISILLEVRLTGQHTYNVKIFIYEESDEQNSLGYCLDIEVLFFKIIIIDCYAFLLTVFHELSQS